MKSFLMFAVACLLAAAPALRAQSLTPEDRYFDIYSLIVKGDRQMEKGRPGPARTNYLEATTELKKFQEDYPLWNKDVVKYRLNYLEEKLSAPETPAVTTSAVPVELKMKWQVGKRYEKQMDATIDLGISAPGQDQSVQTKIKVGLGCAISAVKDRDEGGKELDFKASGVTMSMGMGGNTLMSYDSKNPPSDAGGNPALATLQKAGDLHLTLLTDAKGKVVSVEGLKDLTDAADSGAGGANPLSGLFSGDTFKEIASFGGLPDHPVKVGDSWPFKEEDTDPTLGTIVMDQTCTFKGWEQRENHKCAVISVSGTLSTKPGDNASAAPQVAIEDGKISGEVYFDPALGMPIEMSANEGFSMKVNAQGQSMSTKISLDTAIKLVAVTDVPQPQ